MTTNNVAIVNPVSIFEFTGDIASGQAWGSLQITNITNDKLHFKLKTTKPDRYCVLPSAGTLNVQEDAVLKVRIKEKYAVKESINKDKFMLLLLSVNDYKDFEHDPEAAFSHVDKNLIVKKKLQTNYNPDVQFLNSRKEKPPSNDQDSTKEISSNILNEEGLQNPADLVVTSVIASSMAISNHNDYHEKAKKSTEQVPSHNSGETRSWNISMYKANSQSGGTKRTRTPNYSVLPQAGSVYNLPTMIDEQSQEEEHIPTNDQWKQPGSPQRFYSIAQDNSKIADYLNTDNQFQGNPPESSKKIRETSSKQVTVSNYKDNPDTAKTPQKKTNFQSDIAIDEIKGMGKSNFKSGVANKKKKVNYSTAGQPGSIYDHNRLFVRTESSIELSDENSKEEIIRQTQGKSNPVKSDEGANRRKLTAMPQNLPLNELDLNISDYLNSTNLIHENFLPASPGTIKGKSPNLKVNQGTTKTAPKKVVFNYDHNIFVEPSNEDEINDAENSGFKSGKKVNYSLAGQAGSVYNAANLVPIDDQSIGDQSEHSQNETEIIGQSQGELIPFNSGKGFKPHRKPTAISPRSSIIANPNLDNSDYTKANYQFNGNPHTQPGSPSFSAKKVHDDQQQPIFNQKPTAFVNPYQDEETQYNANTCSPISQQSPIDTFNKFHLWLLWLFFLLGLLFGYVFRYRINVITGDTNDIRSICYR